MTVTRRVLAPLVGAALAVVLLGGCVTEVEPLPTPTAAFATEEEAFAAAEEAYRAYTDALNDRREGDADANALEFLVGNALEAELSGRNRIKEGGLELRGRSKIVSFSPESADLDAAPNEVTAVVCVDISEVRVYSSDAQDVTPAERSSTFTLHVNFIAIDEGSVVISESTGGDDGC